jgi:putative SOS response-associated peptidase YedK
MCSRYNLTAPPDAVRAFFAASGEADFPPRYNIAPTQPVLIVRNGCPAHRTLTLVRWGLIPAWVKDVGQLKAPLINARAETAADKPSFRGPLRHRRCLVPCTGFYEWTGAPGAKQPHLIAPRAGGLMALAGLWEHWLGADGSELETMTILTVAANAAMSSLHDRMPLILAPADFSRWLDCSPGSTEPVADLLRPAPEDLLAIAPVSRKVNNVRNEGAGILHEHDACPSGGPATGLLL